MRRQRSHLRVGGDARRASGVMLLHRLLADLRRRVPLDSAVFFERDVVRARSGGGPEAVRRRFLFAIRPRALLSWHALRDGRAGRRIFDRTSAPAAPSRARRDHVTPDAAIPLGRVTTGAATDAARARPPAGANDGKPTPTYLARLRAGARRGETGWIV
tara:strand:- start:4254 stop:4730 length:477 start_codon:yes stop_codon:yes gene_type:complete